MRERLEQEYYETLQIGMLGSAADEMSVFGLSGSKRRSGEREVPSPLRNSNQQRSAEHGFGECAPQRSSPFAAHVSSRPRRNYGNAGWSFPFGQCETMLGTAV
eukprot:scaffold14275_cov107-Isochrysis_galbana.AAC.1